MVNTLDCVVVATHARVGKQETRKVREIVEIVNVNADGTAIVNIPFKWDASKDMFYSKRQSKVFEKISVRSGVPVEKLYKDLTTRAKLLYTLYKKGIFDFDQVGWIVNEFHKNPVAVLGRYGIRE